VGESGQTTDDVLRVAREAVEKEVPAEQMLLVVLRAAHRDRAVLREALSRASHESLDYSGRRVIRILTTAISAVGGDSTG
jgi:hypothetical protein